MRKNSIKNTRINGEVQRELSNIIRGEIKDPRINPLKVIAIKSEEVPPFPIFRRKCSWNPFSFLFIQIHKSK